ncbi:hypothetical protein CYLTODRAFT_448442 [Cylindrobasidium torrendii FP15055 ss-10]|uniref:Uncharacterized protein n=1 Tax=Cylindrobasidium torrendii FP15055 ss-10 TaxID=1314674 RepID=A0A0D7BW35_9AGAR|nr:hypothetical protein CYLTODRAFT_448442 [Cylindrobasidium torrendii FP15055 ss-10]
MSGSKSTINAYVSGGQDHDSTIRSLTHWAYENPSQGNDEEFGNLWILWDAFNAVAQRKPEAQDMLVQLMADIKALPPPMRNGVPLRCWGGELWKDLPIAGPNMRESWNFFEPEIDEPDREERRRHWVNLNAFAARLTRTGVLNFDLYVIWAMRSALEGECDDDGLDTAVTAAAQWIFIAGEHIYQSERQYPTAPNTGDPACGGPLWTGQRGFCEERWILWRERFEDMSDAKFWDVVATDFEEKQRASELFIRAPQVAAEAAAKMAAIEAAAK